MKTFHIHSQTSLLINYLNSQQPLHIITLLSLIPRLWHRFYISFITFICNLHTYFALSRELHIDLQSAVTFLAGYSRTRRLPEYSTFNFIVPSGISLLELRGYSTYVSLYSTSIILIEATQRFVSLHTTCIVSSRLFNVTSCD